MDGHMSESLDRWITGNYGEDQFGPWGCCPACGASQEDAEDVSTKDEPDHYLCPCGRVYTDEEGHPDPRDDEPQDFDERRED
jgi:hypothetical protein